MAMRGRFASGSTGGTSLSMLVYNIMRSQYARQVEAIVSAYQNNVDYMGEGIPSADRVVAFLQEYSQRPWLTDYERQNLKAQIKAVRDIENQRQGDILVSAMNADPTNIEAVQDYISYLEENISSAETPDEKARLQDALYDAQGKMISAVGTAFRNGLTNEANYDAVVGKIVSTYEKGSPQYQTLLTSSFETKYDAMKFTEYTKVLRASSKGNAAYLKALRNYIDWIKAQRVAVGELGIGTLNAKGTIIAGADGILQLERDLADANATERDLSQALVTQAAQNRVQTILGMTDSFLDIVNKTLGSNYQSVTQFLSNQMDVNAFYSSAPGSLRGNPSFIDKESLIEITFGSGNSLLSASKNAGSSYSGLYESLVGIKKNYGSQSIVDDSAVLFQKWSYSTSTAKGNVQKLTQYHDNLIAQYTNLIEENRGKISAAELYVHEQTLKSLIDARNGKVSPPDTMSAWDLANPFSNSYDPSSGRTTNYFNDVISVVAEDSNIQKDVANGAVQVLRQINGSWEYGEAIYPETTAGGKERLVKTGNGYSYGVLEGVPVTYVPNAPGMTDEAIKKQTMNIGFYYDLGNGQFQILSNDGQWYAKNYDPISGKTMTSNDFRKSYVQTTTTSTTTGQSTSGQAATFVVNNKFVPYESAPLDDDSGFLASDLDLDMKKIDRMYDPATAAKLKQNLLNDVSSRVNNPAASLTLQTRYNAQIAAQTPAGLPAPSAPMIRSAPGGGGPIGMTPSANRLPSVQTGAAGSTLNYFFRNTPVAGTVGAVAGAGGAAAGRTYTSPIKL